MGLHLISNGKQSFEQFTQLALLIDPYIDYFHIREKGKSAKELYIGIKYLIEMGISPRKLIINDRVDIALALNVRGVQLAYHSIPVDIVKKSFPSLLIGCSTHSEQEVRTAEAGGADFLFFGHIFETESKNDRKPKGCELVKKICTTTNLPVIGIGGITSHNAKNVLACGAKGLAVMSGILDSKDPLSAARDYKRAIQAWEGSI